MRVCLFLKQCSMWLPFLMQLPFPNMAGRVREDVRHVQGSPFLIWQAAYERMSATSKASAFRSAYTPRSGTASYKSAYS